MKEERQSTVRRRKEVRELEDGTLLINFPDHGECVLIRWFKGISTQVAMQVALVDNVEQPEKALVVTGRHGARRAPNQWHTIEAPMSLPPQGHPS